MTDTGARPLASRGVVLRLLRDVGPLSRMELARRSELSPTTMTKIVAQLVDEGCVTEAEAGGTGPRVGRPPTAVTLVPEAFAVCGIQVDVGFVRIGVCDLLGRPTHKIEFGFHPEQPVDIVLDDMCRRVNELLQDAGVSRRRLLGVGVGAPGPVDASLRRNLLSINLGWRDVDFADAVEQAVGVPAVVDHNVRAMAVAEARLGLGRQVNSLAYVYVRTGVGAGLVLQGEPFRAGTHGTVELGHLRVVDKGRRCLCGAHGCLETVLSEPYLTEQVRALGADDPGGRLAAAAAGRDNLLVALESAAAAGSRPAGEVLDGLAMHLSTGLESLVNLMNPELVLLGGVFADAPESTFDRIRARLRSEVFPVLRDAVRVERTSLGADAGVAGAAAVALDRLFYQ